MWVHSEGNVYQTNKSIADVSLLEDLSLSGHFNAVREILIVINHLSRNCIAVLRGVLCIFLKRKRAIQIKLTNFTGNPIIQNPGAIVRQRKQIHPSNKTIIMLMTIKTLHTTSKTSRKLKRI